MPAAARGEFGVVGELEDEHLVVRGERGRRTGGASSGGGAALSERGAGDQSAAAQSGGQRDAPVDRRQPGGGSGGDERSGQVDQRAVRVPARSRDDDEVSAGAQQGLAVVHVAARSAMADSTGSRSGPSRSGAQGGQDESDSPDQPGGPDGREHLRPGVEDRAVAPRARGLGGGDVGARERPPSVAAVSPSA